MQVASLEMLLNQVAEVVKPLVAHIEASVATSKDHYVDYMVAIGRVAEKLSRKPPSKALFMAIGEAMQRAGANKNGVVSALRIICGE